MNNFENELKDLINRYSKENGSDTPDHILAKYLLSCLEAFDAAVGGREKWYGRVHPEEPQPPRILRGGRKMRYG